ncbi:hypothetical protein Leryth_004850 [Lithospermum erythrorhizon]|nr:hypothetical protein Leryth_004850 [Lithospermum erythrorhizon]
MPKPRYGMERAAAEIVKTSCMYDSTLRDGRAISREARELPNIEDSIKVANIKPWGMSSSFGLRAGVHKKTNVYMEPSNRDCMAPNTAIFSSE